LSIKIVKCSGAVAVPGKDGLDQKAVETVLSSLKEGDKSFDELLKETRLDMPTLADVLRSVTGEDVVIKGINGKGVIFQYVDC
jgi:predicted methyltransferase